MEEDIKGLLVFHLNNSTIMPGIKDELDKLKEKLHKINYEMIIVPTKDATFVQQISL